MKPSRLLLLLFLAMSLPMFAQTTYTQSQPANCQLADYVCNQIPLGNGNQYSFAAGSKTIYAGAAFTLEVNGVNNGGSITEVSSYPALTIGNQGPFSFTWSANGLTGSVSGYIVVEKVCGRYCWPMAKIQASTVTVN